MTSNAGQFDTPPVTGSGLRHTWPAFVLLGLALLLTFAAMRLATENVATKRAAVFDTESAALVHRLQSALDEKQSVLHTMIGLFDNNVQVVRDVFELFATVPVNTSESISMIAYAPWIPKEQRIAYEQYARNQGLEYLNFSITPASEAAYFAPLEYIVPLKDNIARLGTDINSDAALRDALSTASASGRITAAEVRKDAAGVGRTIIVAPLYTRDTRDADEGMRRAALSGFCLVEFASEILIREAVRTEEDSAYVTVSVYDGDKVDEQRLLFRQPGAGSEDQARLLSLQFAGHAWTIVSMPTARVDAAANASLPYYVLFGGLIVSGLLFAFVFMLLGSRTRAVALADRMTRSQRRIVDTSRDLIGSMDSAWKWTAMNPALREVLGYEVADILGRDHLDVVFPADRDMLRERLSTAPDEQSISLTARYAHKRGGLRWIDWNITSSRKDGRVYCIGRDITDAVLAEKEIVRKNAILDLASVITDRENVRKEQAIRDQNTRFRMEMTSVIGFLELILQNPDFTPEEILDYVSTANEGAQGVMRELHSMTEVELRRMADFRFDIRDQDAQSLLDALRAAVMDTAATSPVEVASADAWTGGVHADMDKIADAVRLLLAALRDADIRYDRMVVEKEQSLTENRCAIRLRLDGLTALPDAARWLPAAERERMTAAQDEAEFARMLLRPMFDIMDASIDVRVEAAQARAVILLEVPESTKA